MSSIHSECLDSDASDRSVAADVLLRQEPDEEEDEEEDEGDKKKTTMMTTKATTTPQTKLPEKTLDWFLGGSVLTARC